jgi:hypothetical protein
MFQRNRWHLSILALIAAIATGSADAADEPFQWTHISTPRNAFYEHAPRSVVALMRAAVKEECMRASPPAPNDPKANATQQTTRTWLCGPTPLVFFRAVNVRGDKLTSGFACHPEGMTPNLRYFTEDMFAGNEECVYVGCDGETGKHFVVQQDADEDEDSDELKRLNDD